MVKDRNRQRRKLVSLHCDINLKLLLYLLCLRQMNPGSHLPRYQTIILKITSCILVHLGRNRLIRHSIKSANSYVVTNTEHGTTNSTRTISNLLIVSCSFRNIKHNIIRHIGFSFTILQLSQGFLR